MRGIAPQEKEAAPYTALAAGYDFVMSHVDYDAWAAYAHRLMQRYHPDPQDVLELGCGTGSLAVRLQPMGPYRYTATDASPEMLRVARQKAAEAEAPIRFAVADFTDFRTEAPADVVLLLYDGLNYLLEEDEVRALLGCAHRALRPGGLFLFDQSTPANPLENADYFGDEGAQDGFAYVRESRYDARTKLHTTTLRLTVEGRSFCERHVQRAYPMATIRQLLAGTPLEEVVAYEDFSERPATEASERVHWLARRLEDDEREFLTKVIASD